MPSETVYGLAAHALDATACQRIFAAKGRPSTDPLIVHAASQEQAAALAHFSAEARTLANAFWPGPLTLVLNKRDLVPDIVTSGRPTVAVRMPAHPVFLELLRRADLPLAAPSANPFGYISPTTATHVRQSLGGRVASILDGGPCAVGLESSILDLSTTDAPRLLRPGAISAGQIESVLGRRVAFHVGATISQGVAAPAPGMLARHYSPKTPMVLHDSLPIERWQTFPPDEAVLLLRRPAGASAGAASRVFWLSESGEADEAARNLFDRLRAVDAGRWRLIHAEILSAQPEDGLAMAINDRLRRAAARD